MHLTILGCGTILQKGTAVNCSGYLLDHSLLFDCGPGIWKALHQHKILLNHINNIFLTHFHVDHTSDLGPLLLNRLLFENLKDIPVNIIGPPGLEEWFSNLKAILGRWSEDLSINLFEIADEPHQAGDHIVTCKFTGHTENSVCYRVEKNGQSIFYSGDTGYNNNLINLATDCQLAVIEASNSETTQIKEHLTPHQAGIIAARAGVQKLILTHMYPEVLDGDPLKKASAAFSGDIILAEEGMEIDF